MLMDSGQNVTANFKKIIIKNFSLRTSVNPLDGGSVSPSGFNEFADGRRVSVTATPANGFTFTSWSGACSGPGSCSVTMDSNKTVTAQFVQIRYGLTTAVSPSNGGTVSGAGNFAAGSRISLQATPNSGWTFAGWSGACFGAGSCSVTMDSNKTVTARFVQQQYSLTATASPSNGGTVSGAGTFAAGNRISLQPTPNSGWLFDGWSGACSGTGSCSVTMDSNKTVTANFTLIPLPVLTTSAGTGGTVNPSGTNAYALGSVVTITATPSAGYSFSSWSGDCSGSGSCSVTMNANKSVSANFAFIVLPVLTTSAGTGGTVSPSGTNTYAFGSVVTITATPSAGYSFSSWSGDCSGSGSCSVTMNANKTVSATFSAVVTGPSVPGFTVTVFAPEITDPTGITVDPNGNIYTINRVGGIATMFGPAGNVIKSVALGGVDLIDIYFDPMTGELFVGGWVSQSVGHLYRFDINGGGSKTLIATLAGISGITGDASGNIYAAQVNAGIVSKITPSGDVTTYATGLNNPDGIAFDPAGRLYSGSRTGQVMVTPIGGGAATNFATLTGAIMDLVADAAGNVYATNADPTQGTITKITPGGSVSSFGTGFGGPQGIVFDASGNLFIANLNSDVIYKVAGVG